MWGAVACALAIATIVASAPLGVQIPEGQRGMKAFRDRVRPLGGGIKQDGIADQATPQTDPIPNTQPERGQEGHDHKEHGPAHTGHEAPGHGHEEHTNEEDGDEDHEGHQDESVDGEHEKHGHVEHEPGHHDEDGHEHGPGPFHGQHEQPGHEEEAQMHKLAEQMAEDDGTAARQDEYGPAHTGNETDDTDGLSVDETFDPGPDL